MYSHSEDADLHDDDAVASGPNGQRTLWLCSCSDAEWLQSLTIWSATKPPHEVALIGKEGEEEGDSPLRSLSSRQRELDETNHCNCICNKRTRNQWTKQDLRRSVAKFHQHTNGFSDPVIAHKVWPMNSVQRVPAEVCADPHYTGPVWRPDTDLCRARWKDSTCAKTWKRCVSLRCLQILRQHWAMSYSL